MQSIKHVINHLIFTITPGMWVLQAHCMDQETDAQKGMSRACGHTALPDPVGGLRPLRWRHTFSWVLEPSYTLRERGGIQSWTWPFTPLGANEVSPQLSSPSFSRSLSFLLLFYQSDLPLLSAPLSL